MGVLRTLGLTILLTLSGTVSAQPLVFAPLPMEQPQRLISQWKPLLDHLAGRLGFSYRMDFSDSYTSLLDKFRNGELDLAYLGPLPYVTLKAQMPAATPVVLFNEPDGQPGYRCAIAALAESGLGLADLSDRRIALTQPLSTCGYLSTASLLRQAGSDLERNQYRYLGRHDTVAIAVARGDYAAGGLKGSIARKYQHLGVRVLAETAPLPAFALVANAERLSDVAIDAIRQALLQADAEARASWGEAIRYGVVPASDRDYDEVRALGGQDVIPERGNF